MWQQLRERIRQSGSALRRRWAALGMRGRLAAASVAGVAVIAAVTVAALLVLRGGDDNCDEPICVEVLMPRGEEVSPMTPVRIRLAGDLDRNTAVRSLQISNEPAGQKRFEGDVLTFRPEWPGFARGVSYDVALRLAAEALPAGADPVDISYRFTTAGRLEVSSIFPPDGASEIALDGAVMIQFNRSVAPLTVISERGPDAIVDFDPSVSGSGRWLNTSLYTFRPYPGWAPATTYTATLKAGLANKLGSQLEADHVFRFSTLSPAVAQILPADNSKFVSPSPEVAVAFNQPVDRASAQAAFSLARQDTGAPVAGVFEWKDDASFVFRAPVSLALGAPYESVVRPGVRARDATAATAAEVRARFETVGVPRVVSTTPANGEQNAERYNISIVFSNPMDLESVEDAFALFPEPEFPPYFGWDESGVRVDIGASFDASTSYRFTLGASATDRYAQPLSTSIDVSFVTRPREPGFHFFRSGTSGTFNAYLDPTIIATSWNVEQLDFELYRMGREHLIGFERGDQQYTPSPDMLVRRWSEPIVNPPLDAGVTTATRLAAPGERLPEGIYYLRMQAPGAPNVDAMPFVVSSANVTTKWTDHDLLIWAVDMQSGAPIGDLPVELLSDRGAVIARATTGDDGVARVDVTSDQYIYPGYYVSAQRDDLVVLAGTNWLGGLGYAGVPTIFKPEPYVGHLYTDRPIYRPGETVEVKGILRSDDDARYSLPPDDEEFTLRISDSQGREVFNEPVSISDMGTFDVSLPLSDAASTGQYYGYLQSPVVSPVSGIELRQVSYLQFVVAEFRKPEFELEVTIENDSYINGETIEATARASLFFGAPLAGAKVDWQVTAQTYFFESAAFPQHRFGDYDIDGAYYYGEGPFFEPQQRIRLQGDGVLDASGAITVEVPADVASDPTSQSFVFEATVTDQNGQIVGAFTGVPVHKGAFYVGIRPEEYVSFGGEDSNMSVVTVDPDERPVAGVPLSVTIYERTWRTVRERTADGEQRFISEPEDTLVQTLDARTGLDGTGEFSFTPAGSGEYRIVATARDASGNEIRTATSTWVSGGEFASWRIGNDDLVQLVADKDEYAPGDTAKVLVAAPFTASVGLVTQERGRLMSYEIRDFSTNSETIEVPITSDHIPNVYVSVALFKAPTPENPRPQAKLGVVELKVSNDEKHLNISIEPDRDQLGPREKVTYKIRTTNSRGDGVPAELSLALVDKSVLSLQDDFARPSIEAFWSQRPLGVITASMFAYSIDRANELTIDRLQSGGKGGGGGPGDESRTFFPNTAYWNPDFRTDDDGEASVEVDLPDTLTTWRLTARGITLDTVTGEARNEIVTSKEVIVRPAVPRFLVADDRASLGVIVHNFTDSDRDFDVKLSADGVDVEGEDTQRVAIAAGDDALVRWDTRVPPGSETASLTFDAKSGDASDSVRAELPVYAFVTPETAGTAGEVLDEAYEAVEVPYYVRPDAGELTVRVSPSLASGVNTALEYVLEYPWESAETTVSRFLPRLALGRAVSELELTDIDDGDDDSDALVRRSLQRLYANQNSDGGFGWWPDDDSDPAVTAYVLIGFGEAKRAGYSVDALVEENAVAYIQSQLDAPRDALFPRYDLRAYMLYGLARDDRADLGRTFALAEQRASLSNTAKAWVAIALGDASIDETDPRLTSLLSDLQASAIASATGNHWEEETYSPEVFANSTQATAQVLQAFTRYQPDHPLVDGTLRWLMVARKDGRWESTHDTAVALLAITDFMIVRKDAQASFRYHVELNGDGELDGSARKGEVHQEGAVVIEMEDLLKDTVNELRLERSPADAAGRLYYTAHLRYFTPAESVEALSNGIGVSHEYFSAAADGDVPVSEIALGEAVRVRVTLVAESDLNFLVLEDFVPAGLEPIDTTLKTTPSEFRRLLYDEQRRSYQVSKRYSPFSHTDIRDNRIALFARFVPKGVYEYTYFAQATTPGEFRVAPATAYEQYFPEVWGRSDGTLFTVRAGGDTPAALRPSFSSGLPSTFAYVPCDGVLVSRARVSTRRAGMVLALG